MALDNYLDSETRYSREAFPDSIVSSIMVPDTLNLWSAMCCHNTASLSTHQKLWDEPRRGAKQEHVFYIYDMEEQN
jgi:hypothetical protein